MAKIFSIINKRPSKLIAAVRWKAFLYKERKLRFRKFSPDAPQGVNLAAYIRAEIGLGHAARGLAWALEAADVPFNILNFEEGNKARHGDLRWQHKEVESSDFDITVLAINPDNIFRARDLLPSEIFERKYVIGYWFWELPNIPDEWKQAFSLVNEVWVASEFVQTAASAHCDVPVTRVPPVVSLDPADFGREYFGLPPSRFLFLTVCDTGSVFERKNPMATIEAFKRAFAPDDENVGLVLKITGPKHRAPNWELIEQTVRGYKNIYLIDRILTAEEVGSLLNASDCLVSLHRSEGFGLLPAEMMSLGKPVIATRWSGNVDYMTAENSVGIDCQLVTLDQDYGPYEKGQQWAEPDVTQASAAMKQLSGSPELARKIGAAGRETIRRDYSPATVGKRIRERLAAIRAENS